MILSEKMRAGGVIAIALLALSFVFFFVFLAGLSPAYAAASTTVAVPLNVSAAVSMPTIGIDSLPVPGGVTAPAAASTTKPSVAAESPSTTMTTPAATPMASPAVSASSCQPYLTSYIMQGQANDKGQVDRLQVFLNAYEGDHLTVTGTYDASTIAAVEAFQSKYESDVLAPWGITEPTGDVYITTTREINEAYCGFTATFPLTTEQQALISASRESMTAGSTAASGNSSESAASTGSASTNSAMDNAEDTSATDDQDMDSSSSADEGTSTSVTNSGLGSFFKNLFH